MRRSGPAPTCVSGNSEGSRKISSYCEGTSSSKSMGVEVRPPAAQLARRQAEGLAERLHVGELWKEPVRIEVLDVQRPQRDVQLVFRPTEPALQAQEAVQSIEKLAERFSVFVGKRDAVLAHQHGAIQRARLAREAHRDQALGIYVAGVEQAQQRVVVDMRLLEQGLDRAELRPQRALRQVDAPARREILRPRLRLAKSGRVSTLLMPQRFGRDLQGTHPRLRRHGPHQLVAGDAHLLEVAPAFLQPQIEGQTVERVPGRA